MRHEVLTRCLTLAALLTAAGCGSNGGAIPDGGGPQQDCTGLAKSQGVSQACCLGYGIDACGASLFCAAFDGRTQPTCYAEHSRLDQETCTADNQCASSSCNTTAGACRSLPGSNCSATIGCADDTAGQAYYCDSVCKPRGYGLCQDYCDVDGDCQSGVGLHCDVSAHRCALVNSGGPPECNPNPNFNTCPSSAQKCVTYGECGPQSGSWTPTKACLDASMCAAGETCYHGGAIPCALAFCL